MSSTDPPVKGSPAASQEPPEPTDTTAGAGARSTRHNQTSSTAASKTVRDSSSTGTPKKVQTKRAPTPSSSAANSPFASRESSPVRPSLNKSSSTTAVRSTASGRSRKNSTQDLSPSLSSGTHTNPPSAAATQRALSVASIPPLHPGISESTIRAPVPQKASVTSELKDAPRWPVPPRLRSPPPVNKPSLSTARKVEQESPSINVQQTPQTAEQPEGKQEQTDIEAEDALLMPGMRTPARGPSGGSTLETVQEISQSDASGRSLDGAQEKFEEASTKTGSENGSNASSTSTLKAKSGTPAANESGSESGGKGEIKMRSNPAPPVTAARPSASKSYSASAGVGRGKPSGEITNNSMTVEAETVSSVPQVNVGAPGNNGTVRAKPSSETIRPKKDKKKAGRKTPSVTSNTASSKADIFEAKVASAVDEADSSDSEETFVYESNPPDISDQPKRYHSRTPSATSMVSQIDQRKGPRSGIDGGHSVAMKKSMKFANSSYHSTGPETTTGEDDGKGTARSSMGTGRGTTHHHHIGRWGRHGGGNGHASLFDNESPFPNATTVKNSDRQSSWPMSPKFPPNRQTGNGKKSLPVMSGYDLDDGADDERNERTPLISSTRSARSNRRRHGGSSIRQLEHQASRQYRSLFARFAGCLVLSLMIILVVLGAVAFMFATTQPLVDVKVLALKNVLASEQDVILDMLVQARNPNIVAVVVDQADLVLFAKSKYAGTNSEWWTDHPDKFAMRRGVRQRGWPWDGDEDDDDPSTNPNLEIGHVYELDSPLTFEGSPFQHTHSQSLGQIRIDKPGNSTTPRGSERWGRVLQHEFELLVRGTLKYTLPLNQRVRSISVEGRVTVKPNAADQDPDTVHIIQSLGRAGNDSD